MAGGTAVHARIVFFGVEGAGVSTSLRHIAAKLRPDHRTELQEVPTRLDPTVCYEILPIRLGEIGGVDTRLEIVAVPGGAEHAPTRKQLLDRADAVVFVADGRRERLSECTERFEELRRSLSAYGRTLESLPFVLQINRKDVSDPAAVSDLVHKLDVPRDSVFETVASEGVGVLPVLSTISKRVVRALRGGGDKPGTPSRPEPLRPGATAAMPRPVAVPLASPAVVPAPVAASAAAVRPVPAPAVRPAAPTPAPELPQLRPFPPAPAFPSTLEDVTGRMEEVAPPPAARRAPTAPAPARLRIAGAGSARLEGDGSVSLPIEIEDGDGTRTTLRVRVSLEADPDAPKRN